MFGLGVGELFIIFLILFLLFGAKNLPEIAKSMGKAIHLFKKGAHDIEEEINTAGPGNAMDRKDSAVEKDAHVGKNTVG